MTIFRNLWVVAHPAEFSLAGFQFFVRQGSRALKGSSFSGSGAGGFEFFARQGSFAPRGYGFSASNGKGFEVLGWRTSKIWKISFLIFHSLFVLYPICVHLLPAFKLEVDAICVHFGVLIERAWQDWTPWRASRMAGPLERLL